MFPILFPIIFLPLISSAYAAALLNLRDAKILREWHYFEIILKSFWNYFKIIFKNSASVVTDEYPSALSEFSAVIHFLYCLLNSLELIDLFVCHSINGRLIPGVLKLILQNVSEFRLIGDMKFT